MDHNGTVDAVLRPLLARSKQEQQRQKHNLFLGTQHQTPTFLVLMCVMQVTVLVVMLFTSGGFASPKENPLLGPSRMC